MRWVTGALLFLLGAPAAWGQGNPSGFPADSSACYGFAFGAWRPALDWKAAGHPPRIAGSAADVAPGGRSWALNPARGDSLLLLFPGWWPAGVSVAFEHPPHVVGDTVVGVAVALVADGRQRAPTARVRSWVVRCG